MQLFYAQGSALAHYLYEGEGGRYRPVLVLVESYYRGEPSTSRPCPARTPTSWASACSPVHSTAAD
jgi:hypothetical protein